MQIVEPEGASGSVLCEHSQRTRVIVKDSGLQIVGTRPRLPSRYAEPAEAFTNASAVLDPSTANNSQITACLVFLSDVTV
jgi:hypothetical protein